MLVPASLNHVDHVIPTILFIGAQSNDRATYFPPDAYHIDFQEDEGLALQTIITSSYDLVVLEDRLFGDEIYITLVQMKQMNQMIPIFVLIDNDTVVYQTNLIEAGADDVLLTNYTPNDVERRLNLCMKRNEQKQKFRQRSHKLYSLAQLTPQLHTYTKPQTLIEEMIKQIRQTFSLYGVAIILHENGILRVYSTQETTSDQESIHQSLRDANSDEPFSRVIKSGITEIFDDISRDRHYISLLQLPHAQSAIVMPMRDKTGNLGALAIFGSAKDPLTVDDLGIYEILITQFALALQNAYFNQVQRLHIHISQLLVKAGQSFLNVQTTEEVAEQLCQYIKQLPNVTDVMVWTNNQELGHVSTVYSSEASAQVKQAFTDLMRQEDVSDVILKIDQGPHIVFQLSLSQTDPLLPLFQLLHARQIIFMPLTDSARLIGGVLISVSTDRQFSFDDANFVKSLSYAAGQALERLMLIEAMAEKSGRLEAILWSVAEGIFFVDEKGEIAFCNPQVTELTNLGPSEILGERPEVLLTLLAEQASDVGKAKLLFNNALSSLRNSPGIERNYPIVEFALQNSEQQVHVEFLAMASSLITNRSWLGLVRTTARTSSKWQVSSEAIDLLLHTLHSTGVQLGNLIEHLAEGHNRDTGVEQRLLVNELRKGAANFEQLLAQYAKFYNLDITKPTLNYETIDLNQLIRDIIRTRADLLETRVNFEPSDVALYVEMDRRLMEQSIVQLLENAVKRTDAQRAIIVRLENYDAQIHVSVEAFDPHGLQSGELTPFDVVDTTDPGNAWADIYLYYVMTHFHHCQIWAENRPDNVRAVILSFPQKQMVLTQPALAADAQPSESETNLGAPLRAPEAVMIITGKSAITQSLADKLEQQHFEVFRYDSPEEAVQDIDLTRLDLIVVDGNLREKDSLEVCKQLRRRTEVPVVIVATKATDLERVEALRAGADDYITEPIGDEELLAKISVLFKRQHLADRTEQPLDLGELRIDFARRTAYVNHKPVFLTRIEYDLLRTLAVNMGQVLTHRQLLEKVWGPEYRSETQYLWVNISRLRKKLEPTSYIHNQQGIGYIFQKT